eukprot:gnl/MRDRNA2_/MRDRNA2_86927_c0_seq1.p1 gnl/MRDRNA2_/MRDRNA2_86927_c0~~gnl/MRDRNA2_/MRDRNA2_86927_c0_seq1.p1  ORF type:complete len:216 (+),score=71.19 gnl/MRDRNA2_/MRDRNA2_86927_c0_seq1:68-715(+)
MFVCVKYGISGGEPPKDNFVNADCACAVLMDSLKATAVREMLAALQERRNEEKKTIAKLTRALHVQTRQLQKMNDEKEKRAAETETPEGAEPKEDLEEEINKKTEQKKSVEKEIKAREDLINTITGHEEKIRSAEEVDLADAQDNTMLNMYEFGSTIKATSVLPLRCTVNLMGIPAGEPGPDGTATKERGSAFPMMCDVPKVERSEEVDEMLRAK